MRYNDIVIKKTREKNGSAISNGSQKIESYYEFDDLAFQ